jgi:geranylgeranyl diphosphate synthase type I
VPDSTPAQPLFNACCFPKFCNPEITMKILYEMLERRLRAACCGSTQLTNPSVLAALDHLEAGGRRVRAHLCMDAGVRLGLTSVDCVCIASVCELLHNASLIQDDLLDRTPMRRGAPSIWERYGDTVAVCTGDLMLSAAYGVLSEISMPALIGPALRLVHLRTEQLILGEAAESEARSAGKHVVSRYEQLAKGKSASLLSLSLELPLLLSGNAEYQENAHRAATDFAIVYQIADDLADLTQDTQERSPNLLLMLMEDDGLSAPEAHAAAIALAEAQLTSMRKLTELLPNGCAQLMVDQAELLRATISETVQAV